MGSALKFSKADNFSNDGLGLSLHDAAKSGKKSAVKRALDQGAFVDSPNEDGQTTLFCACLANQESVAKLMLQRGANPNEKSNNGQTPVLVTCYRGNISLLCRLIEAGGDLRYHDNNGRSCQDWALMNENPSKRIKMLEFVNKAQVNAMTYGKKEIQFQEEGRGMGSRTILRMPESLMDMIRKKVGASPINSKNNLRKVESRGFGRVFTGTKDKGLVSVTPLVQDSCLQFDNYGVTFDNGAFMTMESAFWNKTGVTVKKLQKSAQPGGYIDLLITEAEKLGKLHHPNILLLMGVCQANALDTMMLIFERINVGSLYYYLHAQLERLPTQNIRDIVIQICDGMIFLHHHEVIHCNLSSHAIFLVNPYSAKIGNFEYAMDSDKANQGKLSEASHIKYQNALYNWLAPEIMDNTEPGFYSDVYSYACIIWEIFVGEVPWDMCDASYIKHKLLVDRECLLQAHHKIPNLFKTIIQYGLELEYNYRTLDFDIIRAWLMSPPETIPTLPQKYQSNIEDAAPQQAIDDVDGFQALRQDYTQVKHLHKSEHHKTDHHHQHHHHHHSPKHHHYHHQSSSPTHNTAGPSRERESRSRESRHHHRSSSYSHNGNNHYEYSRDGKGYSDWTEEDDVDNAYSLFEKHPKSPGKWSLPGHYNRQPEVRVDVNKTDDGKTTGYHVKVTSPTSKRKQYQQQQLYNKDSTGSSSNYDEKYDRRTFIPSDNKKIDSTSPCKFSYLALNEQSNSSGKTGAKPASHCTEGVHWTSNNIPLSTAGSLYALYNTGQDPSRDDDYISPPPKPRHRKVGPITKHSSDSGTDLERKTRDINDPSWFGGQGSVRNLVTYYQHHTDEHVLQQSVLDGQLAAGNKDNTGRHNNSATSLPPPYPRSNVTSPTSGKPHPKPNPQIAVKNTQARGKRPVEDDGKSRFRTSTMDDVGQGIHADDSLTTLSSASEPNNSEVSSVASDLLTAWVNEELLRVQRDMQQEISMCSPTKDDAPDLLEEIMDEVCKPKIQKTTKHSQHRYQQARKKFEIDDEEDEVDDGRPGYAYKTYTPRNTHNNSSDGENLAYHDLFSDESYLDLPPVPHKKKSKHKAKRDISTHADSYKTQPNQGGYLTTVRVETSLTHPGHHYLTHTSKDMNTGKTKTLHSEEIIAENLKSSIAIE